MNAKIRLAALKISLVLVAFSAGILFVQPASANPYNPPPFYPSTPNKDPPRIDFQTPVYHDNRVQVNFTVTQPDSWIQGTLVLCTINQIFYELDGKVVTLFDASTPTAPSRLLKIQPYSIELDATEGQQTINVRVNTVSAYDSRQDVNWHLFSHIWLNTTQALTFTIPIQIAPSPSPPPTLLPSPSPTSSPSLTVAPTESPQTSTLQLSPTPNKTQGSNNDGFLNFTYLDYTSIYVTLIILLTIILVIALGVVTYFMRKRKQK